MESGQVLHYALRDAAPKHIEAFFIGVAGVDAQTRCRQNGEMHCDIAVPAAKVENVQILSAVALYLRGINARVYQLFTLVRDQIVLVNCKFFGVLQVSPLLA